MGGHIIQNNMFYCGSCPIGENVLLGDMSNWSVYHTEFKYKFEGDFIKFNYLFYLCKCVFMYLLFIYLIIYMSNS